MPDAENQNPSMPQGHRLTLAFLYASTGEQVLKQLGEEPSYQQAFAPGVVAVIRECHKGKLEPICTYITEVMDAFLEKACPFAKNKPQIAQWVVKQYLAHRHNGAPIKAEDLYKIGENIAYFNQLKNSPAFKGSHDLLSYRTYADFEAVLEPYLQRKAKKAALADEFNMPPEEKAALLAETTILYDGPDGRVVVPHTPNASKYWGSNTKWCIAGTGHYPGGREYAETHFPQYNAKSPVIMILPRGKSDDKIALVDKFLYNSADKIIDILPEPHCTLVKNCLNGLSETARKNISSWVRKEFFGEEVKEATWEEKWEEEEEIALLSVDPVLKAQVKEELAYLRKQEEPLKPLHPERWQNSDFVRAFIRVNGAGALYFAADLRADREIVLAAVQQHGEALEYAAPELQADREIVLAAVRQNGYSLHYAARELQADREIVLAAVRQHGLALKDAAPELRADRTLALIAMQHGSLLVQYILEYVAPELKLNRELIVQLFQKVHDLPFQTQILEEVVWPIREGPDYTWRPSEKELVDFQMQALEKMAARGDVEKFIKYARHFKATWGDPEILFAANPAATLAKIKASLSPVKPARLSPAADP